MEFKHGDRVKCTIKGVDIEDAKISINERGEAYICQNSAGLDEEGVDDRLGYKGSYYISTECKDSSLTNLRLAEKSFDYPEIGDEYVDADGESRFVVLGVAGRVIFLSSLGNKDYIDQTTKERLIECGYTIVQNETKEEPTEMTLEEIEKLVGKKVKIIKK